MSACYLEIWGQVALCYGICVFGRSHHGSNHYQAVSSGRMNVMIRVSLVRVRIFLRWELLGLEPTFILRKMSKTEKIKWQVYYLRRLLKVRC